MAWYGISIIYVGVNFNMKKMRTIFIHTRFRLRYIHTYYNKSISILSVITLLHGISLAVFLLKLNIHSGFRRSNIGEFNKTSTKYSKSQSQWKSNRKHSEKKTTLLYYHTMIIPLINNARQQYFAKIYSK